MVVVSKFFVLLDRVIGCEEYTYPFPQQTNQKLARLKEQYGKDQ